jgi:hypothetical protein
MSLVDFEQRALEHIRAGRRVGISGGGVRMYDDGHSVEINAPPANPRGAALLVTPQRTPEFNEKLEPLCTKCGLPRGIVIVIEFPQGEGEPLQFCRSCILERPETKPLLVRFRK